MCDRFKFSYYLNSFAENDSIIIIIKCLMLFKNNEQNDTEYPEYFRNSFVASNFP